MGAQHIYTQPGGLRGQLLLKGGGRERKKEEEHCTTKRMGEGDVIRNRGAAVAMSLQRAKRD